MPVGLNQNLTKTVCLNCRNVVSLTRADRTLTCPSCDFSYLLFDGIPILLKDPRANLAASWLQHKALIEENTNRLHEVRDAKGRQPDRTDLLDRAIVAYETDNAYLKRLQTAIEAILPKPEIEEIEKEGRFPKQYTMSEGVAFFPRDWCWSKKSEEEITLIMDTVFDLVDAFADDADTILVPGAGAGRFACELAGKYDDCYAFDFSVHMAQIFYDLVARDRALHRVNLRSNVIRTEDVVVEHTLSLDPSGGSRIRSQIDTGNLSYFVGNALDVPFAGSALSAIACLYFIDIVPIREHLNEIRRILKPGGLFINLGPLRYMRGDVANMLSGEEIMDMFQHSGFDILAHDVITNTQLSSSPVITTVLSHNFMFVARKR